MEFKDENSFSTCRFKLVGMLGKKEEVFLRGVNTPMHTMIAIGHNLTILIYIIHLKTSNSKRPPS